MHFQLRRISRISTAILERHWGFSKIRIFFPRQNVIILFVSNHLAKNINILVATAICALRRGILLRDRRSLKIIATRETTTVLFCYCNQRPCGFLKGRRLSHLKYFQPWEKLNENQRKNRFAIGICNRSSVLSDNNFDNVVFSFLFIVTAATVLSF